MVIANASELPQSLRDERYAVIGLIAEGSQGATLDAVDKRAGQPVAIKRFQVKGARSWKDVELAEREARVLATLSHRLLPAFMEHFEEDGALYLVMEKIEGETLAARRDAVGSLQRAEVVAFLHDAAEVLDYLHGRDPPVIHRDIKPGNVIRRPDGSCALVDFGSVRDSLKPKGGSTVVGTFGYMAPEQFQGRAQRCTDVYAVGVTALSLLTSTEPEELPHQGLGIDVAAALAGLRDGPLIEVLQAMVLPDPDRRASSITPLLARLSTPQDEPDPGDVSRVGGRRRRRESTRPRDESPRVRRQRGDASDAPAPSSAEEPALEPVRLPPPLAVVAMIVLTIVRIVLALGLRVLVPLLLSLVSVVFGNKSMAKASEKVRQAGRRAGQAVGRAQQRVRASGRRPGRRGRRRHRRGRRRGRADDSSPKAAVRTGTPRTKGRRIAVEERPAAKQRVEAQGDEVQESELVEALAEIENAVDEADAELRRRRRR